MSHLSHRYSNSKVIGIQFGIASPELIRRSSVIEVTSKETYVNNKPVIGGLCDPRMGVLEPGMICPTDGLTRMDCPGYAGHIVLAKPVVYVQWLATIIKFLKVVCFRCSKVCISKEKHSELMKFPPDVRFKHICDLASSVKACGDDIENGCHFVKPKIKKESGIVSIHAIYKRDDQVVSVKLNAEIILKILRRISDEDIAFMGFCPIFSRPEWMICQVLSICPPPVRPSVKQDSQQRSDDDLTHILVNIVKTNNSLHDKIKNKADKETINNMTELVLQYYIATQVDNKIPGVCAIAQRSGRPYKSIKDRLNGKGGRMRGNLMAKRVDFSARSVITADSNISIRELGVPLKIAKNITSPVTVNDWNKAFLQTLVVNGAENWPGAKTLQKKSGELITLRYFANREKIVLQNGDIVNRHMMNGDIVLFNRQPSLHRPSMMAHIAKIMQRGDTFRLNVAVTKPYNADFDGDEMNLHMPQDLEAAVELRYLAPTHKHIISPANNNPIIGIFQDSMLGSYLFSAKDKYFSRRDAMNLLMGVKSIHTGRLFASEAAAKNQITNYDILSQILPPLSLQRRSCETDTVKIIRGQYLHGRIDKGVLGEGTNGIIHRVNNDFGPTAAADFIDHLQGIVTKFMLSNSFSCGISDLISDSKTKENIMSIMHIKKKEVQSLIEKVQIGGFENNTGKPTVEEFEMQVNNILNQASSESGKIGLKSLNQHNRFVAMVKAGSKGSDLNISFMISCLGQQNVDGKRIPYGFDQRTLPHYCKYDDSPAARGFVESSYVNGLTPQEMFFHAMGGREGLIDTAVKTATTGYIQRRLIKGLEDLKVSYDMTVRNSKNKIIQFHFGDDHFDSTRIENQHLPLLKMTSADIRAHYWVENAGVAYSTGCIELIDFMLQMKESIIEHVFRFKDDDKVHSPVSFRHVLENVRNQFPCSSDRLLSLDKCLEMIHAYYKKLLLLHYCPPNNLFKTLYFFFLSPKQLVPHFYRESLTVLLETIVLAYKRAIVIPGEMVGILAAQSIGEVSTQMTLNTFHFAGVSSKSNVTRGVPRIEEIVALSHEIKNPSLSIYLLSEDETSKERAMSIMHMIEYTKLQQLVESVDICYDPDDAHSLMEDDHSLLDQHHFFLHMFAECNNSLVDISKVHHQRWIIRLEFNRDMLLEKNVTMDDIYVTIVSIYGEDISCTYSDLNADRLIFRIRLHKLDKSSKKNIIDQTEQVYVVKHFQDELLNNVIVRGVKNIKKVIMRKLKDIMYNNKEDEYEKKDIWVLDTIGTNLLDVLSLDFIDKKRTFSNDIMEVYNVLGIEAARQTIYNELVDVIEFDGTYINYHNFSALIDRMSFTEKLISIFRHGINNDDIGPIAKASFEETPEMFLRAARHGELDNMRGFSANVMCGQEGYYGTSAFQVIVDTDRLLINKEKTDFVLNTELLTKDHVKHEHIKENGIVFDNNYELDF